MSLPCNTVHMLHLWCSALYNVQMLCRCSKQSYQSLRQWQPRSLPGCSGGLAAYLWWGTRENSTS